MSLSKVAGTLLCVAGLAFWLAACSSQTGEEGGAAGAGGAAEQPAAATEPAGEQAAAPGQAESEASSSKEEAGGAEADIAEALAKLPEADRAAAEKQGTCPVSGEKLGSMGTPIKVSVKGQDVFICCPGCKKKLNADPDKYLAKLNK